jgi:hypothetical protein
VQGLPGEKCQARLIWICIFCFGLKRYAVHEERVATLMWVAERGILRKLPNGPRTGLRREKWLEAV